jgi:hypothetical protein
VIIIFIFLEHEQDSSVNEQTTDSNELLPTVQQAIHGGEYFSNRILLSLILIYVTLSQFFFRSTI